MHLRTTEAEKSGPIIDSDSDSAIADLQSLDLCQACSSSQVRRVTTAESSSGLRSARGSLVPSLTTGCTCSHKLTSSNGVYFPRKSNGHVHRQSSISTSSTNCSSCNESIFQLQPFGYVNGELLPNTGSESPSKPLRKASTRPIQPDRERQKHNASPKIQEIFREDFALKGEIGRGTWLSFATWWMMKSRAVLKMLETGEQSRKADEYEWTTTTSTQQCYADLLKSSWILEEIVLTEDIDHLDVHQQRTVSHLARALDDDLRKFQENMRVFRDQGSLENLSDRPNLKLAETFEQTIEEAAMNDPSPAHRWFDVDQEYRGAKHEKVIFQTFVNAQLGDKDWRDKSHDAQFTLLLWTMRGETGLFVSLCNQSGTVNLARSMVAEDLKEYERGRVQSTLVLPFDFPNQEADICFVNAADVHAFFRTPKRIFDRMSDKRPRPRELAIFQDSIKSCVDRSLCAPYREQQDKVLRSGKYSSCGLRLYESTDEKCWKTTRRLVISSTAEDDFDIECLSYWLPLDQIQLTVQDGEVTMTWSDCGQLMDKTEGSWDTKYYFIYNATRPNRKLTLEFENVLAARTFEDCLLFPTEIPPYATGFPPQASLLFKVERPSVHQDIRIYRLFDQDDLDNKYHAIVHAFKSPSNFHVSYIYFVYLDIDWIVENSSLDRIELPGLVAPDYESTMRRLPYKPQYYPEKKDPIPEFKEVVEITRTAQLPLGCIHNLSKFMYTLTSWQLVYYHIVPKLSLPNEKHKNVGVQIWTKAPISETDQSCIRLAVRFNPAGAQEERRWLTASLSTQHSSKKDDLDLKNVTVWRGSHVDVAEMTATREGQHGSTPERRSCKISVTFGKTEHKEEFVQFVFGRR